MAEIGNGRKRKLKNIVCSLSRRSRLKPDNLPVKFVYQFIRHGSLNCT
jgi:hypothetical protein